MVEQTRQTLPENGDWINGATLIYLVREINSRFDQELHHHGFDRFRDFLEAIPHVVDLRSAPGKGHMEARRHGVAKEDNSHNAPPPPVRDVFDVDAYLDVLEQLRPRVTPHPQRPNVILRIFQVMIDHQPPTLNELKRMAIEELRGYTHIEESLVEEIIHQLYHTYSFEFEKVNDVAQWDRPCRFHEDIKRGIDLLDNCDLGLLKRLRRGLPEGIEIDSNIVAYVLYGGDDDPRVIERAEDLVALLYEDEE